MHRAIPALPAPTPSVAEVFASRAHTLARWSDAAAPSRFVPDDAARGDYEENLWQKIKQTGELNFPQAAQGRPFRLRLQIMVDADGQLDQVRVTRSSGQPALDRAAVRIVELAAPFGRLPSSLADSPAVFERDLSFRRETE